MGLLSTVESLIRRPAPIELTKQPDRSVPPLVVFANNVTFPHLENEELYAIDGDQQAPPTKVYTLQSILGEEHFMASAQDLADARNWLATARKRKDADRNPVSAHRYAEGIDCDRTDTKLEMLSGRIKDTDYWSPDRIIPVGMFPQVELFDKLPETRIAKMPVKHRAEQPRQMTIFNAKDLLKPVGKTSLIPAKLHRI
jgi:hypothetical protein